MYRGLFHQQSVQRLFHRLFYGANLFRTVVDVTTASLLLSSAPSRPMCALYMSFDKITVQGSTYNPVVQFLLTDSRHSSTRKALVCLRINVSALFVPLMALRVRKGSTLGTFSFNANGINRIGAFTVHV